MTGAGGLPACYVERVYAGILGKLIGVYLGRPFELWTHDAIMERFGPITYYVHDRVGDPLVVTDDDVSGTFTFLRALEDFPVGADMTSALIGENWLNYIIEDRTILWWGGNGTSTEHTAWLNLKKGIAAPQSGAMATNGPTIAEQIGAQIFIDGWALVAPGRPNLAASLAEKAARVSHDGLAVEAAQLWAAMEAAAFTSRDIDALLDIGLGFVPTGGLLATMIADIRGWCARNADWTVTRQLIEDRYGYDRYPGHCHVIPNHALMIMTVLYAPDDFHRAQMIVNTAGWDTDCNAGNVGCLLGIMHGLEGLDAGPDWRGPLADRMLVSSADGGGAITDAVRMAYYVAGLGARLAAEEPPAAPKDAARFHFSLPGSLQGFRVVEGYGFHPVHIDNVMTDDGRALSIDYAALAPGRMAAVTTPTFAPPETPNMRTYELMATPTVNPGQTVSARLLADLSNVGPIAAGLSLRVYDGNNALRLVEGPTETLIASADTVVTWRIPDLGGQPIAELGLALKAESQRADGRILVDHLRIDGPPMVTLRRPADGGDFWGRAWVNMANRYSNDFPPSFRVSQSFGDGMIAYGTRDWTDYRVEAEITPHLGAYAGLAVRVQNARRFYALRVTPDGTVSWVRVRDGHETVLAGARIDDTALPVGLEQPVALSIAVTGRRLNATVNGIAIEVTDTDGERALDDGGIGLCVFEGAVSADRINVMPVI